MTVFSCATFAFLSDLADHRDKQWFEANRGRYESHLLAPMATAVAARPDQVVALGRTLGIGADLGLGGCSRYGTVEKRMDGSVAAHYVTGPHLCALRVFAADAVATDPVGFVAAAGDILVRLVPLWRTYLEGL